MSNALAAVSGLMSILHVVAKCGTAGGLMNAGLENAWTEACRPSPNTEDRGPVDDGAGFFSSSIMSNHDDPFQEARAKCPIHVGTFQGQRVPMILRLKDVREAAKDTVKFSSDIPA